MTFQTVNRLQIRPEIITHSTHQQLHHALAQRCHLDCWKTTAFPLQPVQTPRRHPRLTAWRLLFAKTAILRSIAERFGHRPPTAALQIPNPVYKTASRSANTTTTTRRFPRSDAYTIQQQQDNLQLGEHRFVHDKLSAEFRQRPEREGNCIVRN
jgi:hypothetical protein